MIQPPYPELDDLLTMIGEAGRHLSEIEASEGAAGNISVCIRWPIEVRTRFPVMEEIELPQPVPKLAGATFIVSGSGRRLREIPDEPTAHLACIVVDDGGQTGRLYTSYHRRFEQVTSEFNSHLAVHDDQIRTTDTNFHALIHAQPPHLTYLSHIPRYRDPAYLNQHLLRWQPELIINLPEGIGPVPFHVPGSPELMADNILALAASPRGGLVQAWRHGAFGCLRQACRRPDRVRRSRCPLRISQPGGRRAGRRAVSGRNSRHLPGFRRGAIYILNRLVVVGAKHLANEASATP